MRNLKGEMSGTQIIIALAVIAVIGFAAYSGAFNNINFGGTKTVYNAGSNAGSSAGAVSCNSISASGTSGIVLSVQAASQNPLVQTGQYLNDVVAVYRSSGLFGGGVSNNPGSFIVSGTMTQGSTLAYSAASTLQWPCDSDSLNNGVDVIPTPGTGTTMNSGIPQHISFVSGGQIQPNIQTVFNVLNGTTLNYRFLTSSFVNDTQTADAGYIVSGTIALTQSQSFTELLRVPNGLGTLGSAYGGPVAGAGLIFGINYNTSSAWYPKDVSLAVSSGNYQLTEVPCSQYPGFVANRQALRCYTGPAYSTQTGEVTFAISGAASRANPAGGVDNIRIFVDDLQYQTDGFTHKWVYDAWDSANNNLGQTAAQTMLVVNS